MLTLPVGGNRSTRREPTTVARAFTNSSRKCHESVVGIEPTTPEVIGAFSDDAPLGHYCAGLNNHTREI